MKDLYFLEKEMLSNYLSDYFKKEISIEQISFLSDRGMNKRVFTFNDDKILAIAIPKGADYDLGSEFKKLKLLYNNVSLYFPKPEFYLDTIDQEIMGMEFLPHKPIGDLKALLSESQQESLSRNIGESMGYTLGKTGLFTEEPHDYNILAQSVNDSMEVKLIDADHFIPGNIRDVASIVLRTYAHDREECVKYPKSFLEGLEKGYYAAKN